MGLWKQKMLALVFLKRRLRLQPLYIINLRHKLCYYFTERRSMCYDNKFQAFKFIELAIQFYIVFYMHDVVHSKRIFDISLILVYWFGCIDSSFNIFSLLDRRISKVDKGSTNSNPILWTCSHISLYVSANIVFF